MPQSTRHDLRHFFVTKCIESGVDIPTVSRWLGHKDGGALAMKTYGHLRDELDRDGGESIVQNPGEGRGTAKGGRMKRIEDYLDPMKRAPRLNLTI